MEQQSIQTNFIMEWIELKAPLSFLLYLQSVTFITVRVKVPLPKVGLLQKIPRC